MVSVYCKRTSRVSFYCKRTSTDFYIVRGPAVADGNVKSSRKPNNQSEQSIRNVFDKYIGWSQIKFWLSFCRQRWNQIVLSLLSTPNSSRESFSSFCKRFNHYKFSTIFPFRNIHLLPLLILSEGFSKTVRVCKKFLSWIIELNSKRITNICNFVSSSLNPPSS